jgi:phosphoribosylglycinamide formyltransferase-1
VVEPRAFETREAWAEKLLENVQFWQPDLTVLAGFMRILPPNFVNALRPNLINTHPSLLPAFPGAHAVRDALDAKATVTGVTIHVVDEGVDTGEHLAQAEVAILPDETEHELHERIKTVERQLLVQVVRDIAEARVNLPTPN